MHLSSSITCFKHFTKRQEQKKLTMTTNLDSRTSCFSFGNNSQKSSINFVKNFNCYIEAVDVGLPNLHWDNHKKMELIFILWRKFVYPKKCLMQTEYFSRIRKIINDICPVWYLEEVELLYYINSVSSLKLNRRPLKCINHSKLLIIRLIIYRALWDWLLFTGRPRQVEIDLTWIWFLTNSVVF